MKRRSLLLAGAALAAPRVARAQKTSTQKTGAQKMGTLKFVPFSELPTLDPIVTGNYAVRNHALMVFDTLFGVDDDWNPQPQMLEGFTVDPGGRVWTLMLRPGLHFHDNTLVLARDVVASIRRWAARDVLGNMLMSATYDLTAMDDRTVRIRLKSPFPLLPYAFGKITGTLLAIMPERLARTSPAMPVSEIVGSGPYRYLAAERVPGKLDAYARFDGYVPRADGVTSRLAGPKVAHFDRVEWHGMADQDAAVAALQQGAVDWVEAPPIGQLGKLRRSPAIVTEIIDTSGNYRFVRLNHLDPPFDNPAVRRAALAAVGQTAVLTAIAGADPTLWHAGVGFFAPDSAMANSLGMDALKDPPDVPAARRLLLDSHYGGEKLVMLAPSGVPMLNAAATAVADQWRAIGLDVEFRSLDVTTALEVLRNQGPVDQGGWSASPDAYAGIVAADPILLDGMFAIGRGGALGWPDIPRLVELRMSWLTAADLPSRQAIAWEMQAVCFDQVPFIPLGVTYQPTAYARTLTGMLRGLPLFYNLRRS